MPIFELKLTDYEVATRNLFNDALDSNWTAYRLMIAKVFVHNAAHSLPVRRIVDEMMVTECLREEARDEIAEKVKRQLKTLVREKVLRSRRAGAGSPRPNELLYEVNY